MGRAWAAFRLAGRGRTLVAGYSRRGTLWLPSPYVVPPTVVGEVLELSPPPAQAPPAPAQPQWSFLREFLAPQSSRLGVASDTRKPTHSLTTSETPAPQDPVSATELNYTQRSSLTAERRETLEQQQPGLFGRPRAYSKWTADEDAHLEALARQGFSVEEIAKRHSRQPRAISMRLDRLGLVVRDAGDIRN